MSANSVKYVNRQINMSKNSCISTQGKKEHSKGSLTKYLHKEAASTLTSSKCLCSRLSPAGEEK